MRMQSEASFSQMPKDELLCRIRELQFSMADLALYLDTHDNDETALKHYASHSEELEQAIAAYAARFGALRKCDVPLSPDGWAAWSKTPFPWEKEA